MPAALNLGETISQKYGLPMEIVVPPGEIVEGGWAVQLETAKPALTILAAHLEEKLQTQTKSLLVTTRCSASLATVPVLARRHPDAAVLWFDAHGDCNTPADQNYAEKAYLGGMVLSGAAGEWETGLGAGLDLANVVLIGGRDLDPPEVDRIQRKRIKLVRPGERLVERMLEAVGTRPVYIHIDFDVLSAGLLPTEYQVENGLSYRELHDALAALCRLPVIGLELSECEKEWPDGRPAGMGPMLNAIDPILRALVM